MITRYVLIRETPEGAQFLTSVDHLNGAVTWSTSSKEALITGDRRNAEKWKAVADTENGWMSATPNAKVATIGGKVWRRAVDAESQWTKEAREREALRESQLNAAEAELARATQALLYRDELNGDSALAIIAAYRAAWNWRASLLPNS